MSLSQMTGRQTIRLMTYQIKVENEFATDWMVLLGVTNLSFDTLIFLSMQNKQECLHFD